MIAFLTLLACIVPTLIYVGIIYWADSYEKEPIWLLSAVFLWGAVPAIALSIVLGTFVEGVFEVVFGRNWQSLTTAVLTAPVIEETVKGVALAGILAWRRHDIDTLLDGIIYGAMVGMGFAMVENSFYFMGEYDSGGLSAWAINVFFRDVSREMSAVRDSVVLIKTLDGLADVIAQDVYQTLHTHLQADHERISKNHHE